MKWRDSVAILFLAAFFLGDARADRPALDQDSLNQALRQEAISGSIPHLEKLIHEGAEVNAQAPHGESALEYAIRFGRFASALKLIQLGADPNSEDDSGLSPLLRAAAECNGSRVLAALLDAGADVNHRDLYGRTALMNAAHADCVQNVAILLLKAKNEIEIDARDNELSSADTLARDGLVPQMLNMARKYQATGSEEALQPLRHRKSQ